ncbi:hypothetical protein D9M72_566640 [compost metagenome]
MRKLCFHCRSHSGGKAATRKRNKHRVQFGEIFDNFQSHSSLSGNNARIVEWWDGIHAFITHKSHDFFHRIVL